MAIDWRSFFLKYTRVAQHMKPLTFLFPWLAVTAVVIGIIFSALYPQKRQKVEVAEPALARAGDAVLAEVPAKLAPDVEKPAKIEQPAIMQPEAIFREFVDLHPIMQPEAIFREFVDLHRVNPRIGRAH
jgi:hypothetical protein